MVNAKDLTEFEKMNLKVVLSRPVEHELFYLVHDAVKAIELIPNHEVYLTECSGCCYRTGSSYRVFSAMPKFSATMSGYDDKYEKIMSMHPDTDMNQDSILARSTYGLEAGQLSKIAQEIQGELLKYKSLEACIEDLTGSDKIPAGAKAMRIYVPK